MVSQEGFMASSFSVCFDSYGAGRISSGDKGKKPFLHNLRTYPIERFSLFQFLFNKFAYFSIRQVKIYLKGWLRIKNY